MSNAGWTVSERLSALFLVEQDEPPGLWALQSATDARAGARDDLGPGGERGFVVTPAECLQMVRPTDRVLGRAIVSGHVRASVCDHTVELDLLGHTLSMSAAGDGITGAQSYQPGREVDHAVDQELGSFLPKPGARAGAWVISADALGGHVRVGIEFSHIDAFRCQMEEKGSLDGGRVVHRLGQVRDEMGIDAGPDDAARLTHHSQRGLADGQIVLGAAIARTRLLAR